MTRYEYKVIPAPNRGQRGKGVKGADGKFANALELTMNQMGRDGWEYQRAETLPSEERAGLTGKTTVYRNVLVFRRPLASDAEAFAPKLLDAPEMDEGEAIPSEDAPETPQESEDAHRSDPEPEVTSEDTSEDSTRL